MEWKEQDGWMSKPGLKQDRAAGSSSLQRPQPQTAEGWNSQKKLSVPPLHAVIGARPFCSPEYSPDFYKLGSTSPHSTYSFTSSSIKADASTPHQASTRTRVPYSEKRRLLDKREETEEVKQLDEWRPAVSIFTTLLDGLGDKGS